jgi:predicted DCC family thiol-disulfide oxidoreductase YuxK
MNNATLIYDGECGLCRRAADWVDLNTVPGSVELLPCQDPARAERFPHIATEDCLTAMQLVDGDGSVYSGERAIPHILARSHRRRWRLLALLFHVPGVTLLARPVYALIARNRLALTSFFVTKPPRQGAACDSKEDCE